jgi:hypothetical protein
LVCQVHVNDYPPAEAAALVWDALRAALRRDRASAVLGFKAFDKDGSGSLDVHEVRAGWWVDDWWAGGWLG